jgi:hypothetical protein
VPCLVLDVKKQIPTDKFYFKGILTASAVFENNTYMIISEAEKVGYIGFNSSYMMKNDNDTKK